MHATDVPKTGWFTTTDPTADYAQLTRIAKRSIFGSSTVIDSVDLVGLEDDFRNGKYDYRDYYIGFIDGTSRSNRAKNAVGDMNAYLRALRHFKEKYGDLSRLASVRFHQTNYCIDRIQFILRKESQPPLFA